jgi:hypothetical protein
MYAIDDRRFKQKVGKSKESHIFYKVLVSRVFNIQERGALCCPMAIILLQGIIIVALSLYNLLSIVIMPSY